MSSFYMDWETPQTPFIQTYGCSLNGSLPTLLALWSSLSNTTHDDYWTPWLDNKYLYLCVNEVIQIYCWCVVKHICSPMYFEL